MVKLRNYIQIFIKQESKSSDGYSFIEDDEQ